MKIKDRKQRKENRTDLPFQSKSVTLNLFFLFSLNFKHLKIHLSATYLNHLSKANSVYDTNCQKLSS